MKHNARTWLCLLTAILLLLTGCGSEQDNDKQENSVTVTQGTGTTQMGSTAMQYKSEVLTLPEGFSDIVGYCLADDTLWILGIESVGENGFRTICSMNLDGDVLTEVTYSTGDDYSPISIDGAGEIWLLERYSAYITNGSGQPSDEEFKFRMRCIDGSGQVAQELDLTAILGESAYVTDFIVGGDGTLYVDYHPDITNDTQTNLAAISPQGQVAGTLTYQNPLMSLTETEDDQIMAVFSLSSGSKTAVADFSADTWQDMASYDINYSQIMLDKNGTVYGNDGNRLCRLDQISGEETELLYWLDCDLLDVRDFAILDDGSILVYSWEDGGGPSPCCARVNLLLRF